MTIQLPTIRIISDPLGARAAAVSAAEGAAQAAASATAAGASQASAATSASAADARALDASNSAVTAQAAATDANLSAAAAASYTLLAAYPEKYGAVGNGTTDDTAALQSALNYVGGLGGGIVSLAPGKKYLIDSANLTIPRNVALIGSGWAGGQRHNLDFSAMEGLILNPAYSIHILRGALLQAVVSRKGLTKPTSYREAVVALSQFAGTAIKIGDVSAGGNSGSDACVRDTFVLGFDLALESVNQERVNIENLRGDCRRAMRIVGASDTTRITGTHFWNYFTAHVPWNSISHAVTSVTDNGSGLIRIQTAVDHPFITGDIAHIGSVGGVTAANGRWTVTVVNSTTIDLQGSVFSGAYTSGGTVYANTGIRYGTGIEISACDGTRLVNTMLYGFTRSVHVTGGSNATVFVSLTCDFNPAWSDNQSESLLIDGGAFNTKVVTGFLNGHGRGLAQESTRAEATVMIACSLSSVVKAVDAFAGAIIMSETRVSGRIHIESAAAMLRVIACDLDQATWTSGTPGAEADMSMVADRYNGGDNGAMRMIGRAVTLGTADVTQPFGMRPRLSLADSQNVRVCRTSTGPGTIELEALDGSLLRLNPHSEGLLVGPVSGVQQKTILVPAADHAAMTHELTLRNRPTTPALGELYSLRFEGKDSGGAFVSYGVITAAATTITAGARKGALLLRVPTGASGLQDIMGLTGDLNITHGPSQRVIVDANSHLRLRSYTVATLPSASPAGQMIYVSDLTGGAEPCHSDGTNWRRMSDRTVAS